MIVIAQLSFQLVVEQQPAQQDASRCLVAELQVGLPGGPSSRKLHLEEQPQLVVSVSDTFEQTGHNFSCDVDWVVGSLIRFAFFWFC